MFDLLNKKDLSDCRNFGHFSVVYFRAESGQVAPPGLDNPKTIISAKAKILSALAIVFIPD